VADLFPVVPTPPQLRGGQVRAAPPPGAQVRRDWEFDFINGDLTTTPDGRSVEILRPEVVVAQHCIINLLIEQRYYRIYPRAYGLDYEGAMRLRWREQTHVSVETQIHRQLRHIRGVRDTVDYRWLPYPIGARSRATTYPPPSIYTLATYSRLEQHTYDDLQQTSYAVLEASYEINANELHGGTYGGGDIRDQQYVRFVVVMQPGLPRRTMQVAVPA
jgi:hypothetical protein